MVPSEILKDLLPVACRIERLGLEVHSGTYDASYFGNYVVCLSGDKPGWIITKERGQYILQAHSIEQERSLNHPGVFHSLTALVDALETNNAQ